MKHLLFLTACSLVGTGLFNEAQGQDIFDDYNNRYDIQTTQPDWYEGELSKEGWERVRDSMFRDTKAYDWDNYSRDQYRDRQNRLTEAETACFNAGDLSQEDAIKLTYSRYTQSFESLYRMYLHADTPQEVKDTFAQEYLDSAGKPKLLHGCPPVKTLRTKEEMGVPTRAEIYEQHQNRYISELVGSFSRQSAELPQAGYGFRSTGTGEIYAGQSDNQLDGYRAEGTYDLYKDAQMAYRGHISDDLRKRMSITVAYEDVDGTAVSQVENGTDNTGIVYHDRAPNGSTGVAIGNRGLDIIVESERKKFDAKYKWFFTNESNINVYTGIEGSFSDTTHDAQISTPTFSDIRSDIRQEIDNDYIGAVLGAKTDFEVAQKLRLAAGVEASIGGLFAGLDSLQTNQCGLCAADEQSFTINIEDNQTKAAFALSAELLLTYSLGNNIEMGLKGSAEWRNKEGYPRNPESGDDLFIDNNPTHLEFDDVVDYGFGVSISKRW